MPPQRPEERALRLQPHPLAVRRHCPPAQGGPIEPLLYGGYSSISLGYIGLYEVTKLVKGCSQTTPGDRSSP